MLLAPADKPFDYKHLPRLSLGLSILLLAMAFWLYPADVARDNVLVSRYQQELLTIEWPLYPPFLAQDQRSDMLTGLEKLRDSGDTQALAHQLGFDRAFAESIRKGGDSYLEPSTLAKWQESRKSFDEERNLLSNQIIGLDPQRFRPVTFVSYVFTDSHLYSVLLSVVLLVLVGFAVEWSAGSGVMLCAWMAGSITGALIYLLMYRESNLPLTGSGAALAGVLGLAILEFRRKGSLRLADSVFTISAISLTAILILTTVAQYLWHGFSIYWLIATPLSAGGGLIVGLAARRWFNDATDDEELNIVPVADNSANEEYRKDLNQVMVKLGDMQFFAAEKNIRMLLEKYPGDRRLFELLYQLLKQDPTSLEFEEVAFSLLTLPNQAETNQVALRVFRDYNRRSQTFVALDDNTCLQLVMRFARIDALKEAEELFRKAQDAKTSSPLLAKAAIALSKAFAAKQMEQRASYYEKLGGANH